MKIVFALCLIVAIQCDLFEKIESLVNSKEDDDEYSMFKMNNDPIPHKPILNLYPKFDSSHNKIDEINKLIVIIKQSEKTKKENSIIETPPIF